MHYKRNVGRTYDTKACVATNEQVHFKFIF